MNYILSVLLLLYVLLPAYASPMRFGETLCQNEEYFCITIRRGESWLKLFPNAEDRDIVKRVNRMNVPLKRGMVVAVPKNLDRISIYDVSPFPKHVHSDGERSIYVNQQALAWGAYDENGELVWWGPISSGMSFCPNLKGGCQTPAGSFRVIRKQDRDCISTAFPIRADGNNGGTEMPYCMHFFRGYALHGSESLPGYRASHGCVRLFTQDARWLNEEFISVPEEGAKGTRVIINEL